MLDDFNLLISTARGNERNTCSEAWYLLGELGDRSSKVDITGSIGLVVAKTALDPVDVVRRLKALLKERPWEFRYVLKVVPLQKVVKAELDVLRKEAAEAEKGIGPAETYKIVVEKRHTQLSSKEIIDQMASAIDRKVDLERPQKVVMVQVIADRAGISLIGPDDVLSVEREKRASRLAPSGH